MITITSDEIKTAITARIYDEVNFDNLKPAEQHAVNVDIIDPLMEQIDVRDWDYEKEKLLDDIARSAFRGVKSAIQIVKIISQYQTEEN